MRPRPFRLHGITTRERHETTRAVERAVREAGGWITDFQQFSNIAVVLELQVPRERLAALHAGIEAQGVSLRPSLEELLASAESTEELTGTLRLEFAHNEPELRIEIPAVPG